MSQFVANGDYAAPCVSQEPYPSHKSHCSSELMSPSDTEKFYTQVQEIMLARYNKTFDWSLKAKMMGKKAIEAARVFVEETGISDSLSAEDFLTEREEMLRTMFPTSELMPGIACQILS